jgi:hypothetical protein
MLLKKSSNLFILVLISLSIFSFSIIKLGYIFDITKDPVKVDLILCLGGGEKQRLKKTIELYKLKYSEKILLTNKDKLIIDKKILVLKKEDIAEKNIFFKYNLLNTFDELSFAKELMIKYNYKSILIISDEPHSLRINMLIKSFINFKKESIEYTIVGSNAPWWNKKIFYTNKDAIRFIIMECFKIIHNYVFYTLSEHFTFQEKTINSLQLEKKEFIEKLNKFLNYLLK